MAALPAKAGSITQVEIGDTHEHDILSLYQSLTVGSQENLRTVVPKTPLFVRLIIDPD
jgi:hypothetical protein